MASSVGRGRGYGGRNKELRRPGQVTESDTPTPVSQRLVQTAGTANAQSPSAHQSDPRPSKNQKPLNSAGQKPSKSSSISQKPSQSSSGSQNAGANLAGGQQKSSPPHLPPQQYTQKSANMAQTTYPSNVHVLNKPNDPSTGQPNSRKVSQEERNFCGTGSLSDENSQSVLYIDERFSFFIKQVSLLSNQDDGILTNQKLQHIDSILTKTCTQPQMLRQALDAISSAAILDSRMSSRISLLCCSVWFSRSQLLGQRLHHLFIESMTDKIDGLEISLEGADQYLVNAATLLADVYTESKILGPEELVTLARLIVQVSIELLECNTQLALRTLNVQLMQHGRKLYHCVPDKLETLSVSARKLLISRQPPAPNCKIWLMLLSDQCLYKLEPLPKYLQDFYARHLDDSTSNDQPDLQKDRLLQVKQKEIAKQDAMNKTGDARSKDNRTRKSDSSDRWSTHSNGDRNVDQDYSKLKDDVFEEKNPLDSSYDSSGVSDSNFSDNNEYCSVNGSTVNSSFNSERKPRPILGAGSRMVQNSNVKSDFEFNEPPPGILGVNDPEDLIPKFCPSIPPPNFVPRVKQATSASQDNTDFWNKPPPPINTGSKMENMAPKMPTSGLAGRLDLNSWRQQANGVNEEEQFSNQPTYNQHRQRKDSFENQANFYASSNEKQPEYYTDESKDPSAHFHYGGATNTAGLLEKVKTASNYGKQNPNDYDAGDLEWKQGWNEETAVDYESEVLDNSKESEKRLGRSNSDLKDKKNPSSRMNNYEPHNEYTTYRNNAEEEDNYDQQEESFKKLQIETGTLMWSKNIPEVGESGDKSSEFDRNGDKGQRKSSLGRHQQKSEKDRRSSDTRQDRNFNRERKENDEKDSNWRRRDSDESKNTRNSESKQDSGKWSNKSKDEVVDDWNEDGNERAESVSGSTTGLRRDQRGSGRVKRDPMESSRSASYWTHDDRCDRDYDG